MIALGATRTHLRSLGSTTLFEAAMIRLNCPGKLSPLQTLQFIQVQAMGCPVIIGVKLAIVPKGQVSEPPFVGVAAAGL